MVQLYSKVSNPLDVGSVTKQEMASETRELERVFDDNRRLREELELLKSQARYIFYIQMYIMYFICTCCKI